MSNKLQTQSNPNLELQLLGGLIFNGEDAWIEISDYLNEKCFTKKDNQNLYRVCKALFDEKSAVDPMLVSARFASLSWSWSTGSVLEQIDNLMLSPLSLEGTISATKEVVMLRVKRDMIEGLRKTAKSAIQFEGTNLAEFNCMVEEHFSDSIQADLEDDALVDLHKLAYENAERAGEEGPQFTIQTPWPSFNRAFTGLRPKDTYCYLD
jgi:replicative DNA helicase